MLRRSSSTPDTVRLAEALSVPGIDPRLWVSNAVVNDDGSGNAKTRLDATGYLVEVTLLPSGIVETARVGTLYNGPSFGLYFPLGAGDTGLVIAPDGSPDAGLVWIPKMWSPADPPPPDAVNAPADVHLILKQDANLRLVTSGAGNLTVNPTGSGQVVLGAESGDSALEPAVLGKTLQQHLQDIYSALNALFGAFNTAVGVFNVHTHGGVTAGMASTLGPSAAQVTDPTAPISPPNVEAQKVVVK